MKLRAYIDESGTHRESEYLVLGGVVSSFAKWRLLAPKWQRILDNLNSGDPIHAKQLIKRRHNKELVDQLFDHAFSLVDFGLTVSVKRKDFTEFYKHAAAPSQIKLDSEYGLLFGSWIETARAKAKQLYANKSPDGIWVVLEQSQYSGRAEAVYNEIAAAGESEKFIPYRGFSLGHKRMPGIQLSDMISHMGWRREGRPLPEFHDVSEPLSPADLKRITGEPLPVYRSSLDPAFLIDLHSRILAANGSKGKAVR
jgi:Protein of unknown function (DUF3800)